MEMKTVILSYSIAYLKRDSLSVSSIPVSKVNRYNTRFSCRQNTYLSKVHILDSNCTFFSVLLFSINHVYFCKTVNVQSSDKRCCCCYREQEDKLAALRAGNCMFVELPKCSFGTNFSEQGNK